MRTPVAALVVALGLAVSGLAGCSAEAEPEPLPPVASASPSVAPVPSPPAEAAAETPDGASAFARYYLALASNAYARGDASALRAVSAAGCGGCDSLISNIETVAGRGERQVSGDLVVKQVASPPLQNREVVLLVDFSIAAKVFEDASGKVVATTAPVPNVTAQMRLIRRGSSWVVQGYRVLGG